MICFPLDNTPYQAKDMGAFLDTRTRGVFSADTNLAVSADGTAMAVTVSPGLAWLKWSEFWGTAALQEQPITLNLDTADGALKRIDAVVCRLDKVANKAEIVIKKGAFSSAPVLAAPVRDANFDELYLATVLVSAGATVIQQADITDKRMDEAVCGLMRDGVTGLPTSSLQSSAEAVLQQIRDAYATTQSGAPYLPTVDFHPETGTNPLQPKTDNALTTVAKTIVGAIGELLSAITGHKNDKANPHAVTKAQVGLGNVDNTADAAKTVSRARGFISSAGDLGEVVVDTTSHNAWWLPYSGTGSYGGTRKIFAAVHADDAQKLTGKSLTMTLSGSTLNVTWG